MSASAQPFDQFAGTESYIADTELSDAVNVAMAIQRPLLIKGEPGTGKTLLATAIAKGLGMPLYTWHVKSTSKAQEGLYVYDTVQRLNDARFGEGDVSDISNYIKMGPVGQAFRSEGRAVLLIDEIDKADLEFPNDLLHELDAMSFMVHETSEVVTATHRPVVIITSNNEKELPDAFLRRCVFHWIAFPGRELMRDIIAVHHPRIEDSLIQQAIERFYAIRELPELRKRPSTSELVDWIAALARAGVDTEALRAKVPFLGVLLKSERDEEAVRKRLDREEKMRTRYA